MSKSRKPKAKKAAPQKSGLIMKSSTSSGGHTRQAGMIPTSGISSSKKGSAQNNAPRKAQ
ncbi:MAG TPA: hypothetical protein VG738_07875 [Chitinophagaceae bacterium]|nr:hypothetical protein [Chitinophagaceae bacterium]